MNPDQVNCTKLASM